MLRPIRRVVTGNNSQGRSIIESDTAAPFVVETPFWPGTGTTGVWVTTEAPANNEDRPQLSAFPLKGSGGVAFMIMHIQPESQIKDMSPANRALATMPVARLFPEAFEIDVSQSPQMHATDTMDYLVLLSGELTLLVDEGEVTLKPMDTVIQRGVNHGWVNRGTEVAIIMSAVIDARPLDRTAYPPKSKPHSPVLWGADKA